ncbi:hypothetical protein FWG95_01245 [Candidatus Saccharibacteria bacterium]|nr:hypothetical protein [Candidatus Saccharibacteria bacterium]
MTIPETVRTPPLDIPKELKIGDCIVTITGPDGQAITLENFEEIAANFTQQAFSLRRLSNISEQVAAIRNSADHTGEVSQQIDSQIPPTRITRSISTTGINLAAAQQLPALPDQQLPTAPVEIIPVEPTEVPDITQTGQNAQHDRPDDSFNHRIEIGSTESAVDPAMRERIAAAIKKDSRFDAVAGEIRLSGLDLTSLRIPVRYLGGNYAGGLDIDFLQEAAKSLGISIEPVARQVVIKIFPDEIPIQDQ